MKKLLSILAIIFIANQLSFAQLTATITNVTNVSCNGACDGTAQCVVLGGVSPYYFYWDNGAIDDVQTNLCAGVYTVTVTDSNSDNAVASVTITESSTIIIVDSILNSHCEQWDGAIYLSVTGGCGVYTYQWSNSSVNQDIFKSPNGVYCVTVTDCNGCVIDTCSVISDISGPTTSICSQNDVSCNGGNDGSATVCVSGGTTPYTYMWDINSGSQNTPTAVSLVPGYYVVTVTDSTGCSSMAGATIAEPSQLVAVISSYTMVSCWGVNDGTATVNASGGTSPYTYLWDTNQNTPTATNLSGSSFSVTVSDAQGCSKTTWVTITQPMPLTVTTTSTNTSCAGFCDGTATAIPSGGTAPYTYLWFNGVSSQTTSNLCVLYNPWSVTIVDNKGCTISASGTLTEPTSINISTVVTDATCLEANGSATINITNGVPPYSYLLLNDTTQVTSTLTNLSAGAYFVEVSDSTGCSKIDTILINNIGASEINIVSLQNVRCNGTSTGSVSIAASGGISPYTISWSHGLLNSLTADTLFAGNYIVTVADSVGCVAVQNFGITQPGTLFLYVSKTDANCASLGTATAHPFGGTQPYMYLWNNSESAQTAISLFQGDYSVTVIDANDCIKSGYTTVNQYCKNLIKGKVFIDNNDDCIMDSSEAGLNNITLKLMPGYHYAYTNSQGEYSFLADSGSYTISVVSSFSQYYSLNCPANPSTISVTLNQMGDTLDGNNFAFVYDSTKIDLQTYLSSDIARPGFNYHYYINYRYYGHDTINATLTLTYDSILNYSYSSPAETYSSYPEIKWDLTLAPNAHGYVYANFVVPTIQNGGYLGRVLHSTAKVEPFTNDLDTLNNVSAYNRTIVGSYDPNEKEVFPVGYGALGAILPTDSVLTYTIHFQNTGTDTAFTVVVVDTLSSYVEPATVVSGASSHPYEFELSGQGILKWTFNQILLVDSTTNEPASNGFVTYTVKQKANNPHAALIENKAEIFFDFNPNITTNTATNKVDYYLSIKINETSQSSDKIEIYPNPFNENATISVISNNGNRYEKLEIYNITGSKVKTYTPIAQSKNFEIQKGDLKSGIYFIKLNDSNKHTLTGKLIVY